MFGNIKYREFFGESQESGSLNFGERGIWSVFMWNLESCSIFGNIFINRAYFISGGYFNGM